MKKFILNYFVITISLTFIFTGCTKPPEAEKKAAIDAMAKAVAEGSEKYSAVDFNEAKNLFNNAESKMKSKTYDEAKKLYLDSRAAYNRAIDNVEQGKKAMLEENKRLIGSYNMRLKELQKSAKKYLYKMKANLKKEWNEASKNTTETLKKIKENNAADPAESRSKLDELKDMLDKWETKFQELSPKTRKKR